MPLPAPTRWERPFDAKEEKAAAFSSPLLQLQRKLLALKPARVDAELARQKARADVFLSLIHIYGGAPFDGALGFAFVGFCSDKGVARNKGRTGTALAPDFVRGQMSNLPCTCLVYTSRCV